MCYEWEYDLWLEELARQEQREAKQEPATEEQATEEAPRRTFRVMPPAFDEPSPVPRRKLLR